MDHFTRVLEQKYDELTKSEKVVADYFISGNPLVSSAKLSSKLFISASTISRFVKKLGFESYDQFYFELKTNQSSENSNLSSTQYNSHIKTLDETYKKLDFEVLNILTKQFSGHRILVSAFDETASSCIDFTTRLKKLGLDAHIANTKQEIILESNLLKDCDIFIAVSISGHNETLIDRIKFLNKRNIDTYSITGFKTELSSISKYANYIHVDANSQSNLFLSNGFGLTIIFDNIINLYMNQMSSDEIKNIKLLTKDIIS